MAFSGCKPSGHNAPAGPPGPNAYLAPPSLTSAAPGLGATVLLEGRATPGLRVRLETPAREQVFANVDAKGTWRVQLPARPDVQLFELSMGDPAGERMVRAEGYVAVTPQGRAAQLRAASGSVIYAPAADALTILGLDFDRKGGAVVSGLAAPGLPVSVRVDGVQRGQATADQDGRFAVALNDALAPGRHDLEAVDSEARAHTVAQISPAPTLTAGPFRADRQPSGWRIDWMTPGGGAQTTLMIENSEPVT
jgi:hypothetical protein